LPNATSPIQPLRLFHLPFFAVVHSILSPFPFILLQHPKRIVLLSIIWLQNTNVSQIWMKQSLNSFLLTTFPLHTVTRYNNANAIILQPVVVINDRNFISSTNLFAALPSVRWRCCSKQRTGGTRGRYK
jgi:hypothetical protein